MIAQLHAWRRSIASTAVLRRSHKSAVRGVLAIAAVVGLAAVSVAQTVDSRLYSGLVWRNIGPFRGGRVSAVSGAIGQPGVYYIGLPQGGVWKTTSAGETWLPIFDSIKDACSIGSVAVAPSDPNIVYVGMGDGTIGTTEGSGLYKSIDAGKTWARVGLEDSRQIPSILVDPHDPNVVLAAALGNGREHSANRGIYRSTDGGKSWAKTLYLDNETGAQKLAWADDQPNVVIATTNRHYFAPGAPRRGPAAAAPTASAGTRLYKSTDEGVTWTQIKDSGLPTMSGRTCVVIANGTNSQRMYLIGNFGLYRSDDGGAAWRRMDATDPRVSNGQGGYNCGVYVDPIDPNVVYIINTSSYVSKDGGATFTGFKGAPGGDDPQQMWIDPTDANRMILGTDQGATVSLDGGDSWSSWYNQPTAQVYHISVDNQFPYWVYATQQDSGCIATSSRGNLGAITPLDWLPHPGYEFGSIVADPRNPKISYSGGPDGGIVKVTYPSGQWINVSPNLDPSERLRQVGNQPMSFSPTNPRELMLGFQYLMATTDGGMHWHKLSPDLGYPKGMNPPKPGGPPAPRRGGSIEPEQDVPDKDAAESGDGGEQGPQPFGGSIEAFSPSTLDGGIIWVGTNNGLIKLTKDHGATWEDVTIPHLPNPTRADISGIDASHQDPATAYVAVNCQNMGDNAPYFYRTHDYGKTWTKIVNGLPSTQAGGSYARVIRADTKRAGLLFAGTESSMYVSFDDGDTWQSLMLNLPTTSYRDMVVKDNDLVVGTYGRGFWVLDDISPLRQIAASMSAEPARLFKPGDTVRVRRNVNGDTPFPPEVPHALNPPLGAVVYYYLGAAPHGVVSLDVTDSDGKLVRHMSSAPIPPLDEPAPPEPDFWIEKPAPLPTAIGMNRVNWNLRYDSPPAFTHSYEINATPGDTPASPEGPLVPPGVYTITLTVDGSRSKQTVTVRNDPRSPASDRDVWAQHLLAQKMVGCAKESWDAYHQVAAMRDAVAKAIKGSKSSEVSTAATAFDAKLALVQGSVRRGGFFGGGRERLPSFSGVNGAAGHHLLTLDSADMAPNEAMLHACEGTCKDLQTAQKTWKSLNQEDLVAFNAVLAKAGIEAIPAAAGMELPRSKRGEASK